MQSFSCLAIDMGAGSIRIMLAEISESISLSEVHRFNNEIIKVEGYERWNLPMILKEIEIGLQKAFLLGKNIHSVAVDSWGVDFVLLDENETALDLPVAYRDARTDGMQEKWKTKFLDETSTFEKTGINFYPFNSLFQFLSMRGEKQLQQAKSIMFMANYIAFYLCGVKNNELSLSSTTQLLNKDSLNWDEEILNKLQIKKEQFPAPKRCGMILGNLNSKWNQDAVKVCLVPSHDTAAAIESIPYQSNNFAYISTGTWCVMGMKSNHPIVSEKAFSEGITNEITDVDYFKVHKNAMGLWLIQKLKEELAPELEYGEFEKRIAASEPSKAIIDSNDERLYNPSSMKTAFDEIIAENGFEKLSSLEAYGWCAYRSLAASFGRIFSVLEELKDDEIEVLHMIGGGIQSEILCQLTANAVGVPVIAGPIEGATIGNVLWQARAFNFFEKEQQVETLIRNSFDIKTYYPKAD